MIERKSSSDSHSASWWCWQLTVTREALDINRQYTVLVLQYVVRTADCA